MGQIANQMALELIFKIKERIKEKKEEKKQEKAAIKKEEQKKQTNFSLLLCAYAAIVLFCAADKLEFSERQVIFNLMETCGMQAEELLVESEAWIYGCIFKIKKYLMA